MGDQQKQHIYHSWCWGLNTWCQTCGLCSHVPGTIRSHCYIWRERQLGKAVNNTPIRGSRWMVQDCVYGDCTSSMSPRADFLLKKRQQQGEVLSSSTLAEMHSALSKPDSQLSTSLFHYCGPKGPWERHGEMHILERYKSRQFGGSSALNHCFLFKGKGSLCPPRKPIKTAVFYSRNLYFTLSCCMVLHKKNRT